MIIAVDFDGTIVEHRFPAIGPEKPNALQTLKHLQGQGHKIIIWTCREDSYIEEMNIWFKEKGFKPDAVNHNFDKKLNFARHKIYADIYIDDRNLGAIIDWSKIENELKRIKF